MNLFISFLVITGLFLTLFGAKLLLNAGFAKRLRRGPWKPDEGFFSSKEGYLTDRYIRGLRYLITGLIILAAALYSIL